MRRNRERAGGQAGKDQTKENSKAGTMDTGGECRREERESIGTIQNSLSGVGLLGFGHGPESECRSQF